LGGDVVLTESEPTKGSTFTITVDTGSLEGVSMVSTLEDAPKRPEIVQEPEAQPLKGYRILVVEDGEDNQILFSNYLLTAGAEVDIAEGGNVGIHKALSNDYHTLLMDIQMPDID